MVQIANHDGRECSAHYIKKAIMKRKYCANCNCCLTLTRVGDLKVCHHGSVKKKKITDLRTRSCQFIYLRLALAAIAATNAIHELCQIPARNTRITIYLESKSITYQPG